MKLAAVRVLVAVAGAIALGGPVSGDAADDLIAKLENARGPDLMAAVTAYRDMLATGDPSFYQKLIAYPCSFAFDKSRYRDAAELEREPDNSALIVSRRGALFVALVLSGDPTAQILGKLRKSLIAGGPENAARPVETWRAAGTFLVLAGPVVTEGIKADFSAVLAQPAIDETARSIREHLSGRYASIFAADIDAYVDHLTANHTAMESDALRAAVVYGLKRDRNSLDASFPFVRLEVAADCPQTRRACYRFLERSRSAADSRGGKSHAEWHAIAREFNADMGLLRLEGVGPDPGPSAR